MQRYAPGLPGGILLSLVFLVVLIGCFSGAGSPGPRDAVVRLGYFPNVTHAQAVVGVERGDFARAFAAHGVELETVAFNAGPSVIEAVYAGELDIAYIGPSPTLNGYLRSGGAEVRVIAGAVNDGVLVVGSVARGIERLEQLRGGVIATPQLGNTQDISAKHHLRSELGAELKDRGGDTTVLPIANPDIENLMRKGQLDAAWLPEPWASRLVDRGIARVIARESDLWPEGTFGLTNVIVRRRFLEERPDLVRAFLRTHLALTDEIGADPAAHAATINAHMAAITGKTLSGEVMASALASIRLTAEIDRTGFGRFLEHGQGLGYLPTSRVPSLDGLFDDRLLEEARLAALPAATGVPAP